MTTAQHKGEEFRGWLQKLQPEMQRALPRGLDVERFQTIALTTLKRTPKLMNCGAASVLGSIMECAQLGLQLDGTTGQAYLVPYKGQCVLVTGYKGLILLATQGGHVRNIEGRAVYAGDRFRYTYGLDAVLEHEPVRDTHAEPDPSEITHAYAIARFTSGGGTFEVMTRAEIERLRKRSPAGNSGPWVTDYEAMAIKTPIRRLCKYLPLRTEVMRVLANEERMEAGLPVEPVEVDYEVESTEEPPADPMDKVTEGMVEPEEPEGEDWITAAKEKGE
jgi:recombination protein RecT